MFRGGATRRVIQYVRFASRYAAAFLNVFLSQLCLCDHFIFGEYVMIFFYFRLNVKLQQFKPDYTAPPALFHYSGIPMNFRYLFAYFSYFQGFIFCCNDRTFSN